MRQAVAASAGGGGLLQAVDEAGAPTSPARRVDDLAAAIAEAERAGRPRWVWAETAEIYSRLVERGVRVDRCHDLALTEGLLLGNEGRWGEPRLLAAAEARARGRPVPDDPPPRAPDRQPALFDQAAGPEPAALLAAVVGVHAAQLARVGATEHPDRMRLLVAAESAGALAAAEMSATGLPWRRDLHDALLRELLGPRPEAGGRPSKLAELADAISETFGGRPINPDSPAELVRAFAREGLQLSSTRAHELKRLDHPAVPLLLKYKELARLHSAHGWAWLDTWVHDNRFRPEYVPGGVVSGRWATRGGGALQIPHAVRRAVVADPEWALVVADAAQLEPRVLAALSGDHGLGAAAAQGDLYEAIAANAFGGDRSRAKVAVLSAMYGGTGGEAGVLLGVLRRRFPAAVGFVEAAARAGEEGGLVRSRLGRTCPPPSAQWREQVQRGADPDAEAGERRRADVLVRDRGRFTRNFVVQASAADWALVLLAGLRRRLTRPAELVFFQHDEVVVHCPRPAASDVSVAVHDAAAEATGLVFGPTSVRFPLEVAVVDGYSDAK